MASLTTTESSVSSEQDATDAPLLGFPKVPLFLISGAKRLLDNIDVWTVVAIIGMVFVTSLYLLHIIALCYAKYRLHRPAVPNSSLPGVSVIKPIIGIDGNLSENLESFFMTSYHKFEILFCFNSKNDPAVQIVKDLIQKYQTVEVKMFFGGEKVGLNPKINNMMPAYRAARFPLIMISDSAIFIKSDGILDMAATIMSQEKMALVTQTPYCKDRKGFDAAFEQVYFGTSHGRIYLAGNCMDFVCPTGMSSMIKKAALDECGGFAGFGDYLAEDYFFGRKLANLGYKSAISTYPALQNSASVSISLFVERIGRWIKLRMAMLPHIILVEPLQDCFPSGLIISFCLNYLAGIEIMMTLILHTVFWFSMDYLLMSRMQNGKMCFSLFQFVGVWLLRELTAPLIFLKAALDPSIRWRDNVFHLAWGGRIVSQQH